MTLVRFRLRRDTAANWTSINPVLALGEPGLETNTRRVKYGDGTTAWNSLAYSGEAFTASITALAALTPAADRLPYFTSTSAAALATLTSYARSLLDDSDAPTARGTLGLGTAATMTGPSGTIVGTSDTQTLTNKTVSGATISGTTTLPGSGQITSAGRIGVGGAPSFPIHIVGATATDATLLLQGTGGASGTLRQQQGGNVTELIGGVGLTANQVSGVRLFSATSTAFTCRSATTASAANLFQSADDTALLRSTSSLKYKYGIEDLDPQIALATFNSLRPIYYRSTAEADRQDWSWYGLAAEEVAEIDPRLVHWTWSRLRKPRKNEHGLQPARNARLVPDGVQYERALLVALAGAREAIRSLQDRVSALEATAAERSSNLDIDNDDRSRQTEDSI